MKITVGGIQYTFLAANIYPGYNWQNASGIYTIEYTSSATYAYPWVVVALGSGYFSVGFYQSATSYVTYLFSSSAYTISGGTVTAVNWTGSQLPTSYFGTMTGTTALTAITYP
jgi:hypothetical protein